VKAQFTTLVVEDEPSTNAVLTQILLAQDNIAHIASVASINEATPYLQQSLPDILLVDLGLPDGSGIELIRLAKANRADIEILVITTHGDEQNVMMAFQAGATGYLLKDQSMDDIEQHIQHIIQGESPISPTVARYVLQSLNHHKTDVFQGANSTTSPLTDREVTVLDLLAKGCSRVETAQVLGLSKHTITTHIKNIYKKLSVNSRTEAVFEAYQLGLIKIKE